MAWSLCNACNSCLQPAVCCIGRSEHEGCSEVQLFIDNTNQMMKLLLYALGEDGAASEDLAEVVANGGVLLSGIAFYAICRRKLKFHLPHCTYIDVCAS